MSLFSIASLLLAITCFIVTIIIFIYGRTKTHRVWLLCNLAIFIWGIGTFLVGRSTTESAALISWRLAHLGGLFIAVFFYHMTCLFCEVNRKKIIIFAYAQVIFFQILNLTTSLFISRTLPFFNLYYTISSGLFYPIAFLIWLSFVCLGHLELARYYKTAEGIKRTQVKYLFAGFLIGFLGGTSTLMPIFGINIYPFGNFTISLYSILVTYAILKHQLMEIEVIIKKTLVFAGLFASSFAILVLPTLIIQEFIVSKMGFGGRLVGLGVSAALLILILRPLENFLINTTDKYLFQKKYDYKKLLKTFTGEVLTVLDINRLTKLTAYKLADIIKLVSCGVLLFDEEKDGFTLAASYGIKEKNIFLGKENTLATFMERTRAYLSVKHQGEDSPLPKKILRDMNILKVELAIPLVLHSKMIGILTLGKKKSDEKYTQDDIDVLLPLARTLAIAIGNAELFDELSKTQAEAAQREKMAVIGTLSAGINHEICNPLGIVRGQCEAFMLNLKDGLYKDKSEKELLEKAIDIMKKSIKEVDRATAVTKRLSTFAKPIKEIKVDEVKVRDEINEVMALVGHELRLEKIEVIQEIPDDLPGIIADRKQIEEIFFNLIRNAGQAIGEEGRITIRAKFNGNNKVLIEIEDSGHGIPENKIEQIFNPFYTTKEPGKGTGLGLFIVRQVIEKNKGKISVKSKIGVGTTFTLEFPAATKVEV